MAKVAVRAVSPAKGFGSKGWVVLLLAFFSMLMNSMIIYDSLNVTITVFAGNFGVNVGILYMFSTLCAWISVPGAVLFGWLSKKVHLRFAWALGLIVNAIAVFIWGQAGNPSIFFIGMALANICGMGYCYMCTANVISNWFPTKKGLAMGIVTIGFPLSATIATPLCSAILQNIGLSNIYIVFAVVCVVLGVLVFALIRDYPEQAGAYPDNDKSFNRAEADKRLKEGLAYQKISEWQTKKFLKTGNTWKIVFALGVMELFSLGVMTNFVPRMQQIGYTVDEVTPLLAIAGIVACIGSYLCGVLDSKVGPKKAIIITYCFGIFSLLLNIIGGFVKVGGNDGLAFVMLLIAQPFLGIMLGGAANYLVSLIGTIWGRYDFDGGYRIMKPLVAVVGALGMTVCGGLGNALPMGYGYAYGLLCLLAVISVFVTMKIDDTYVGRK